MSRLALALAFGCLAACMKPYPDTVAPSDARFQLSCEPRCGTNGRDPAVLIEVGAAGLTRQYALCCEHRAALLAELQTIEDLYCDGLAVPPKSIGGLTVATAESESSGKRGATIDDGSGYVSFNCGEWLTELIAKLRGTSCCRPPAVPRGAGLESAGDDRRAAYR